VASFVIASLPANGTGVLQLGGNSVSVSQRISIADAANLTFDPAVGFVGNAFFTYTATDNQSAISAPALYTIPVGRDNASVYTATPVKGGANEYQNGGTYTAAAAVADNGVRTASADVSTLPTGTQLDPVTGQLTVADRTLLAAGTYNVTITTVDVNGGVTTQVVPVRIGDYPLPVELTRFEAKAQNLDGNLSWATAQELNNAGFQVERSFDGLAFTTLTFVAGAGTSLQPRTYSFVDAGVGQQHRTVYYRLQQRDLDGKTSYSPVRAVTFAPQNLAASGAVALYPNPATDRTTLDLTALPSGSYQVQFLDLTGRLVQTQTLAGGLAHTLTVDALPSGTYLVLISDGTQKFTQRLTKN
jgi:hypothetical protein